MRFLNCCRLTPSTDFTVTTRVPTEYSEAQQQTNPNRNGLRAPQGPRKSCRQLSPPLECPEGTWWPLRSAWHPGHPCQELPQLSQLLFSCPFLLPVCGHCPLSASQVSKSQILLRAISWEPPLGLGSVWCSYLWR